jgi:hypothetical protein
MNARYDAHRAQIARGAGEQRQLHEPLGRRRVQAAAQHDVIVDARQSDVELAVRKPTKLGRHELDLERAGELVGVAPAAGDRDDDRHAPNGTATTAP